MAPETSRSRVKSVWLGTYDTAEERGWYPITNQSRFNQLFVFTRKSTIGDATKDSDDFISSWILFDLSGGGQVEDYNEGAETNRFWTSNLDTRSPGIIALGPLVTAERPNSNCSKGYPLEVGNDGIWYDAFNESGTWEVWGFNETTDDYDYNGGAGVALGSEPAGHSVRFDGVIYVPRGSSGYTRITGSAGTPTCTTVAGSADPTSAAPTSAPRPVAFCIFEQKLWALTAEGGIAYHTLTQKDAGANAWTWPYGDTTTDFPQIDSSATPLRLIVFPDKNGVESIYAKTTAGVYVFDHNHPRWIASDILFPPHPDINGAAAVWRPGEALHLGVGLDDFKYTAANVLVPFSGLNRDHGLPQEYRGAIIDLESTLEALFALVGNRTTPAEPYTYATSTGVPGSGDGEFNDVVGIAVDSSGNVWAADENNSRVQKFDSSLSFVSKHGVAGSGDGEFHATDGPNAIAFAANGDYWVVDRANVRLQRFNSSSVYQSKFGASGTGNGQFTSPWCVTINQTTGRIYVSDELQYRIQYFDSTGTYAGQWGSFGAGDGQFAGVRGIVVHQGTGDLYVSDGGSRQIKVFTADGTFVRKWTTAGTDNRGIAIHPTTGNVLITDIGLDYIQEYSATGTFIRNIGAQGTGNGQFMRPEGIAFNSDGSFMYVCDASNEDIQKFAYDPVPAQASYPTVHAWPGIGWHGIWRGTSNTAVPTHLRAGSATNGYKLRWGMDDGFVYRMDLRRTLHNPRQGFLAGIDRFAASGELITGWFDAAMAGFFKWASHCVITMDSATANETVTVEFAVDGGGWESLGTVSTSGETVLEFDVIDGFSRGRKFKRIRFRLTFARGATNTLTPVMESFVLCYTKVPKNATAHTLEIPLHRKHGTRTPAELYEDLTALVETGEALKLVIGKDTVRSDGTTISATKRVWPATISGLQDGGVGNTRHVTLGLIEIKTGAS